MGKGVDTEVVWGREWIQEALYGATCSACRDREAARPSSSNGYIELRAVRDRLKFDTIEPTLAASIVRCMANGDESGLYM